MSLHSRFFGGPEGAIPEYNQTQFAEVFKRILSDGIFSGVDNEFEVTETDPVSLGVKVNTGWAFIQGFWAYNDDALIKTLGAADPSLDRIDRIVLRLDTNTNFQITVEVLEGTPSADPSAPALTQTDSIYEIELAQVEVKATVTSISNANITDGRDYVTSSVDDIATIISDLGTAEGNITTLQSDVSTAEDDIDELSTVTTTIASSATPTPARASVKTVLKITAQAADFQLQNPTGTPVEGDLLKVEVTDDGTPCAITYDTGYADGTATRATTTTASTRLVQIFEYDGSNWLCMYSAEDV